MQKKKKQSILMPLTWAISTCKKKKVEGTVEDRIFVCRSYSTRTSLVQCQYYGNGSNVWCQGVGSILFGRSRDSALVYRVTSLGFCERRGVCETVK